MIGIKNSTGKKIVARYDGRDYTFPADEKVVTPLHEDAARHIFGYGERDKSRALLRLGWLQHGAAMDAALEQLGQVQFLAAEEPKFKEETQALPMAVSTEPKGATLSDEEQAIGEKLAKPEAKSRQIARER